MLLMSSNKILKYLYHECYNLRQIYNPIILDFTAAIRFGQSYNTDCKFTKQFGLFCKYNSYKIFQPRKNEV